MAVRPVVLEAMFMSLLLDHHILLLELASDIEKIKAPESAKEHKGIEKFLQPGATDTEACQTTIETTSTPENS